MKEDEIFFQFPPVLFCNTGVFYEGDGVFVKKQNIRAATVSGIFGSIGFILMLLEFSIPIIPSFVKLDFSEIPALIVSFAFGPVYGILVCLIKNLLHLFVTSSAGVGELSNFILGALYVGTAGLVYKKIKTRLGALTGSLAGAFVMAVIGIFTNLFVVYPAFSVIYGMPMNVIIGMYTAILPTADTLLKALIIFNLPFNFFKGVIDAVFCFAVYKYLSPILKGASKNT